MKSKVLLIAVLITITLLTGCRTRPEAKVYDRPLPPGQLALRKITNPADIPDLTDACYDLSNLRAAVDNSLNYLGKPSSKNFYPYGGITHADAVASLQAFRKLIDTGLRGWQLSDAILEQFDVYESVGCDNEGTVLFTGYYTPIFDGSLTKTEQFKYPLYKQPDDLVKGPNGEVLGRRGSAGNVTPYPSRADLETSGELQGKELIWLADPFEVYIAHVQGSAKVRMPDGKLETVGYAASNGHEYRSLAKEMVKQGLISSENMSLAAMIDYFKRNIDKVAKYTQLNPRFIFFRMADGGPRGSLNEPVIKLRSIATDKSIYPRACLALIKTRLPRQISGQIFIDPYSGFVLDQDTGGAIRAAGRCDVYIGEGDLAGELAGRTYQEGRMYYFFLKPAYRNATIFSVPPG